MSNRSALYCIWGCIFAMLLIIIILISEQKTYHNNNVRSEVERKVEKHDNLLVISRRKNFW